MDRRLLNKKQTPCNTYTPPEPEQPGLLKGIGLRTLGAAHTRDIKTFVHMSWQATRRNLVGLGRKHHIRTETTPRWIVKY